MLRQRRTLLAYSLVGLVAVASVAYLAISFRVAETVTQVDRVPLATKYTNLPSWFTPGSS